MSWTIGETIGNRYELRTRLHGGGMADVWIARDITREESDPEAPVVIKSLHRDLQVTGLLFEEFEHVITLQHPNIVQVHHVGEHDGVHFIVMEYLRGKDLSRVVGRVAERTAEGVHDHFIVYAAWIIRQVCQALACAHAERDLAGQPKPRIIHRDISPQNIVLMLDGGVKLIDFGISRALEKFAHITRSPIWGKTMYMPPEQWLNKGVNERSDIFALGVVMFDVLTGDHLFYARKSATERPSDLEAPITRKPSACSRFPIRPELAGLAADLDPIVLKALAIQPEERHASAEQMGRAIDSALRRHGFDSVGPESLGHFMQGLFKSELEDTRQWPGGLHAGFFREAPHHEVVLAQPPARSTLPPALALILIAAVVLVGWTGLMLAARMPLKLAPLPDTGTAARAPDAGPPDQWVAPDLGADMERRGGGGGQGPRTKKPRPGGPRPHKPVAATEPTGKAAPDARAPSTAAGSAGSCPASPAAVQEIRSLLASLKAGQYGQARHSVTPGGPLVSGQVNDPALQSVIERQLKAVVLVCGVASMNNDGEAVQAELNAFSGLSIPAPDALEEDPLKWCKARVGGVVRKVEKRLEGCE